MKNKKIGIIVEGPTDKDFFEKYIKVKYPEVRGMKVMPSSTQGNCKIQEEKKIKSKIQDLRDKSCNEIYILVDLDSECKKKIYTCVVELRNDYVDKMKLTKEKDVNVVIVSSELEAWMMSAWKKSDKATKEDLKRHFGIKDDKNIEQVLLQKFLASKQNIDCNNNESLRYFIEKLGLECK